MIAILYAFNAEHLALEPLRIGDGLILREQRLQYLAKLDIVAPLHPVLGVVKFHAVFIPEVREDLRNDQALFCRENRVQFLLVVRQFS